MSHVTHVNESCLTRERCMSPVYWSSAAWRRVHVRVRVRVRVFVRVCMCMSASVVASAFVLRLYLSITLSLYLSISLWGVCDLTCKRGSVGQSEGMLIPRSSVRFRLKPENSISNGFELHRP